MSSSESFKKQKIAFMVFSLVLAFIGAAVVTVNFIKSQPNLRLLAPGEMVLVQVLNKVDATMTVFDQPAGWEIPLPVFGVKEKNIVQIKIRELGKAMDAVFKELFNFGQFSRVRQTTFLFGGRE